MCVLRLYVYVCMYIYMYICVKVVCIYVYMCVYIYICIYVYVYIYVFILVFMHQFISHIAHSSFCAHQVSHHTVPGCREWRQDDHVEVSVIDFCTSIICHHPFAILHHAPLIPAGMIPFRWNPQESAGMAQESAGMGRNPQEWHRNLQEWTKMDTLELRV